MTLESILRCPVCENALHRIEKYYQCTNRHSFDISREGYVNLLLANQKASKKPGDSRDMLQSRRRFLEDGHFHILSTTLNQLIYQQFQQYVPPQPITILEAGCGEGYYLGELHRYLGATLSTRSIIYWGLDIAKDAVQMAAKRYQPINFLVASTRQKIPIIDRSVHILLTIFAPRNAAEYQRIVVENGIVIVVIPGKNHLRQLRILLKIPQRESAKQAEVIADFQRGFRLDRIENLMESIDLDNDALLDLVKMTPNYWHITPNTWEQLRDIEHLETQIEFLMLVFQRSCVTS